MITRTAVILLVLSWAWACTSNPPQGSAQPVLSAPGAGAAAPGHEAMPAGHPGMPGAPADLPAGHPPIDDSAPTAGAPQGPLRWTVPEGWVAEPLASQMRVAQWRVPGAAGAEVSVAVFYFGAGQGGSVEANIDRWYGQFTQPDGRATREVARRETRTVAGMSVAVVDIRGTFSGQMMPGMGAPADVQPLANHRMLGVVIETRVGPYFVKVTGPAAAVERAKSSVDAWIGSLRLESV